MRAFPQPPTLLCLTCKRRAQPRLRSCPFYSTVTRGGFPSFTTLLARAQTCQLLSEHLRVRETAKLKAIVLDGSVRQSQWNTYSPVASGSVGAQGMFNTRPSFWQNSVRLRKWPLRPTPSGTTTLLMRQTNALGMTGAQVSGRLGARVRVGVPAGWVNRRIAAVAMGHVRID